MSCVVVLGQLLGTLSNVMCFHQSFHMQSISLVFLQEKIIGLHSNFKGNTCGANLVAVIRAVVIVIFWASVQGCR